MSDGREILNFWVHNPDFRLYKKEDPNNPQWCAVARPLIEWGDNLISRLSQDPVPGKVGFAKWKLLDRYARLYHRTANEHRPECNNGRHHCIHEALLSIWQKLEDIELAAAIPELEPPPVRVITVRPTQDIETTQPTKAEEAFEPPVERISGIVLGVEEEEERSQGDDDYRNA